MFHHKFVTNLSIYKNNCIYYKVFGYHNPHDCMSLLHGLRADDTMLYCNVNNFVTDDLLNYELSNICDCLGANKLSLNVLKTKFMVFHTITDMLFIQN